MRIFYDEATERIYTLIELEEGYNKTITNNAYFKEEYPIFNNYLFEALGKNGTLTELTTKNIIDVVSCDWGIYKDNENTQYIVLTSGKLENQNTGVLYVPYKRDKSENIIKIIEL